MPTELAPRPSIETESEMLPQNPPPWFVRSMGWLLIFMFAVALLAAIVVRLPETVTCPFVLTASQGADPIQSPRQAVVHQVAVNEGQQIRKGETLFVLGSDEIRGLDTESRTLGEDLRSHEESLAKADAAYASQLEIKTAEISQAESEVKFREKHASTSRDLVARMEKLSKRGGIAQVELIKYRLDAAESEKDLSVAQRTLQQVTYDRERIKTENARQRNEDLAEIEKIKFRLSALKGDMENSQVNLLTVRAPYDAIVISLAQRNAGNVVQSGQELCQLARVDSTLRARLVVSEAGLPKLAVGQRVRLFVDAFPYQRYGVVNAKLDWVSPSAVTSSEGLHFIALASLDNSESRRRPLPLRAGMGGQARIVVGQRTMIEYAFEPIRQLRENMHD